MSGTENDFDVFAINVDMSSVSEHTLKQILGGRCRFLDSGTAVTESPGTGHRRAPHTNHTAGSHRRAPHIEQITSGYRGVPRINHTATGHSQTKQTTTGRRRATVVVLVMPENLEGCDRAVSLLTAHELLHAAVVAVTDAPSADRVPDPGTLGERLQGIRVLSVCPRNEIETVLPAVVAAAAEAERKQVYIRQEHAALESMIELSGTIFLRHNRDGRRTFVNYHAVEQWGISRTELESQRFLEFVHPDDREATREVWSRMQETGETVYGFINRQWTPRGYRTIQWNCCPVRNECGEYKEYQAAGNDITELRAFQAALEASEARYRALTEDSSDVVAEFDQYFSLVYISAAVRRVLGYSPSELHGGGYMAVIHEDDLERVKRVFSEAVTAHKDSFRVTHRTYHREGPVRWMETSARLMFSPEGGCERTVVVSRDITERVQAEQELRNEKAKVEPLLHEKTLLVQEANHRMKNDISRLRALMWTKAREADSDHARETLTQAGVRLAITMRMYDRLQSGGQDADTRVRPFIYEIFGELRSSGFIGEHHLSLSLEDFVADARSTAVLCVLLNELITNSIKHGGQLRAEVHIRAEIRLIEENYPRGSGETPESSGRSCIELVVSDDGPGYPEEVLNGERRGYGLNFKETLVSQRKALVDLPNNAGARTVIQLIPDRAFIPVGTLE